MSVLLDAAADKYTLPLTGLSMDNVTIVGWAYHTVDRGDVQQPVICVGADASTADWYYVWWEATLNQAAIGSWDGIESRVASLASRPIVSGWYLYFLRRATGNMEGGWANIGDTSLVKQTRSLSPAATFTGKSLFVGPDPFGAYSTRRQGPLYIFDSYLSDAQILAQLDQLAPVQTPWAWFPFNNATLTDNVYDQSGNNRNLTASGTPTVDASNPIVDVVESVVFSRQMNSRLSITGSRLGKFFSSRRVEQAVLPEYAGSFIAATLTDGDTSTRHLEHSDTALSFYHDGEWWAAFPSTDDWYIQKFHGTLPAENSQGGWTVSSPSLLVLTSNKRAMMAYDQTNGVVWFLAYSLSTTHTTYLHKLTYSSGTWSIAQTIDIRPGALTGNQWYGNGYVKLGLDGNGTPILTAIGTDTVSKGLHLAYPTDAGFTTWAQIVLDADTTRTGEDSRADIINFQQSSTNKVGIVYSRNSTTTDAWVIASHNLEATPSNYSTGWSFDIITTAVAVDDHISAVSDGTKIYVAAKDNVNSVWLFRGLPGAWDTPVKLVDSDFEEPSRPSLFLDTSDNLHLIMQGSTGAPHGSIYHKTFAKTALSVDNTVLGDAIITQGVSPSMIDPKRPAMIVGSNTGNKVFIFAKSLGDGKIWYCQLPVS